MKPHRHCIFRFLKDNHRY
ncbi:hypothetical protein [Clostridium sp.]